MGKKRKLTYIGRAHNGVPVIEDRLRFKREVGQEFDGEEFILTVEEIKDPKTWPQLKGFHGPVLDQIQECLKQMEGVEWPKDRIKHEMKLMFLEPEKLYFKDGTPMMEIVFIEQDDELVPIEIHKTKTPSLADLSKHEMSVFIQQVIDYFWQNYNWSIVIELPVDSET